MLRPWKLIFPLLCSCSLVLSAPTYSFDSLSKRQFNGPQTVTTVNQFQTPSGLVTETCTVTLTPIKDSNGQDAVREEKECKISLDSSTGSGSASTTTTSFSSAATETSSSSAGGTTTSSTSAETASTTVSTSSSKTTTSTTSAAAATGSTSSSNNGGVSEVTPSTTPAVSAHPVSTISLPTNLPTSSSSSSTRSGTATGGASSSSSSSLTGTPTTPAAASAGGSNQSPSASPLPASTVAAAAENASSSAVFQIPGKQLQVLPIGLGVFAGISVIAIVVVGLVTYERTKYRRAFRQRKLAEQAEPMPYGGMSEMPR